MATACGGGGIDLGAGSSDGGSGSMTSTGAHDSEGNDAATTEASTTGSQTETTDPVNPTQGSAGGTGGEPRGVCTAVCDAPGDCCPLGALGCPGDSYPHNWSCEEGFCQPGGCSRDADCATLLGAQQCHVVDGIGTCVDPCTRDQQCLLGACTGTTDDGDGFCQGVDEQPCASDGDCGGQGRCDVDSGACWCADDADCTALSDDACRF